MVLFFACLKVARAQPDNYQISYVIEPFDHIEDVVFVATSQESTLTSNTNDSLFGNGEAKLTLEPKSRGQIEQVSPWDGQRHNCIGATHFSLWYKAHAPNCELSLHFLIPEVPCSDPDCTKKLFNLEIANAPSVLVPDQEWHELVWRMDNADAGLTDNLDQLLGWFISVYRGAESGSDRTSSVLFDQFACYGSGELFGAAFKTRSSVDRVGVQGLWQSKDAWRAYSSQSDASLNRTHVELVSQRMIVDPYVIEHTDAWGGSLGLGHSGPFSSYYNLSGSRSLSLA